MSSLSPNLINERDRRTEVALLLALLVAGVAAKLGPFTPK